MSALLDRLERLEREATPGPWDHDGKFTIGINGSDGWTGFRTRREDAALIAEARNALPLLIAVARAAQGIASHWTTVRGGQEHELLRAALAALDAEVPE